MTDLEFFCFDVLQDYISKNDYIIEQDKKGNYRVVVLRTCGVPKEIIREDWNLKAKGTELEKISLYL